MLFISREYDTGVTLKAFQKVVWAHYKKNGRHDLPWRKTRDPYKILVSEVMLQQTQVERVKPFYIKFIRIFPTARRLAATPLASVLQGWQGLGYNRRAKFLHEAAKQVGHGIFPKRPEELEKLSGVGPYTARAVAVFAYNTNVVLIETNIRTAILHHFFADKKNISDTHIIKILEKVLPKGRAREWYAALMDYGAYLKQSGVKLNTKSKHYTKQSAFAGSLREARGAILRELSKGAKTKARLTGLLGDDRKTQLETALNALLAESLIQKRGKVFTLPR